MASVTRIVLLTRILCDKSIAVCVEILSHLVFQIRLILKLLIRTKT